MAIQFGKIQIRMVYWGMMVMGKKEGWKMYAERNRLVKEGGGGPNLGGHHLNFLACIRDGKKPHADIEIGHLSSSLCHLANIAIRTGGMLHCDPKKERMVNDAKADKLGPRE